jgi:hypothetical protein
MEVDPSSGCFDMLQRGFLTVLALALTVAAVVIAVV